MNISRRKLVAASGTALVAGLAGCSNARSHDCDNEDPGENTEAPRAFIGDSESDTVVQVYEDFGCPACRVFYLEEFPPIQQDYVDEGLVRWEHWDYPIPASQWSEEMASAGRGILDRQGPTAFFDFAKGVYETQNDHSFRVIGDLAEQVGADRCEAITDAEFQTYEPVINEDRAAGTDLGIGVPAVLVDGEPVTTDGIPRTGEVSLAIEDQLE